MKNQNVKISKGTLPEALEVNSQIPEFEPNSIENKLEQIDTNYMTILIASIQNKNIGYAIFYDRYQDGSLYAWMAAVIPEYRKLGAYKKLAQERESYAHQHGYKRIRIKTRNGRREMLSFLIKNNWNIIGFDERSNILDSRIEFSKELEM